MSLKAKNVKFTRSVGTTNVVPPYTAIKSTTFSIPDNPARDNYDRFGYTVAANENYVVAAAPFESYQTVSNIDNQGAVYIFNSAGTLLYTIFSPDSATWNNLYFGQSLAVNDTHLIIGQQNTNYNKVHVYELATGNLVHTVDDPNTISTGDTNSGFGWSVDISDNYFIVGAPRDSSSSGHSNSGSAYVFSLSTGNLVHAIENFVSGNDDGLATNDYFGKSVAMTDSYFVVGTPDETESSETIPTSGKVYVFDTATGTYQRTIDNPSDYSTSNGDQFGYDIAIDGTNLVVTAAYEDTPSRADSGMAYVFNVTTGAKLQSLVPVTTGSGEVPWWGWRCDINGNKVVLGTRRTSGGTTGSNSGSAYVFDITTGNIDYSIANPGDGGDTVGDYFGYDVAITSDSVYVGAPESEQAVLTNTEYGYLYKFALSTGNKVYSIENPNINKSKKDWNFGYACAIVGNNYWVSARGATPVYNGSNGGAVWRYDSSGNVLSFVDNPYTDSNQSANYFGTSMRSDGTNVIVGAYNAEVAHIFDSSGTFLHTLSNPSSYASASNDDFGWSVDIDGNYAIVGAPNEDTSYGASTGTAYIFDVTTGGLVRTIVNPNIQGSGGYVGNQFGYSVAISGNYAIISEPYYNKGTSTNIGAVHIYDIPTGNKLFSIEAPDQTFGYGARFGKALYAEGDYVAVSAPNTYTEPVNMGKVYLYQISTGTLVQTFENPMLYNDTQDTMGNDVSTLSISGNYLAVGVPNADGEAQITNHGMVIIYDITTAEVKYVVQNPSTDGGGSENFGWSVSLDGLKLLVGARNADNPSGWYNSGVAYLFTLTT